jgi:hypothetical protein
MLLRPAGVSERPAYCRLDDSDFRAHLTALRGEMVSRATGRLADASTREAPWGTSSAIDAGRRCFCR